MRYEAKESYAKLKVNYIHFDSVRKHEALLAGEVVEITSPPKELLAHLKPIKEKVEEENGSGD